MAEVVYKLIADDLRDRIVSGELAPGTDVPTEAELAHTWKTSRGPIRNALATLRQEGLIETMRGRPARVSLRKPHQPADVSIPFTRWAQGIGAVPGAATQEVTLRKASADKAEQLGVPEGTPIVDVLRLRSLDGRPAMLERLTFLADVGRSLLDVDLDAISITEHLESQGHPSYAIDHEIDAVAADDVDSELLGVDPGSPILRLRRMSHDADGRVFEASDDRYLPDVIRFTVSASGRSRAGGAYVRPLRAL